MDQRTRAQRIARPGEYSPQSDGVLIPSHLGPADMKPSQPRAGDPGRRILLPGCDYPPADATPVDEMGDGSIVAGATATLVTVQVPDTKTFRISGIGFGADDETALRFLQWNIRATPPIAPIPGYSEKAAAVGSIPQLSYIFAIIGSSVTIEVRATNNNLVLNYFICRLLGWFYTEAITP